MANGDEENMANGDDVNLDFRPVLPPGPTSIIFRIEAVVNKVWFVCAERCSCLNVYYFVLGSLANEFRVCFVGSQTNLPDQLLCRRRVVPVLASKDTSLVEQHAQVTLAKPM